MHLKGPILPPISLTLYSKVKYQQLSCARLPVSPNESKDALSANQKSINGMWLNISSAKHYVTYRRIPYPTTHLFPPDILQIFL